MPRKQNGFGNAKSLQFHGAGRTDKGKVKMAPGTYPSNRRFGTSVHRTVIEQWDIDSNWVKWRKGYEIWNQALYSLLRVEKDQTDPTYDEDPYQLAQLLSILYQGTDYPTSVVFTGFEYPTLQADVNTHYVAKRTPLKIDLDTGLPVDISMGFITEIWNDPMQYPEQKAYGEIWVKGAPNARGRLLLQMINERLTDGVTEASVKNVLTGDQRPAVYYGVTAPKDVRESSDVVLQPTQVKLTIPLSDITLNPNPQTSYRTNQGLTKDKGPATRIDVENEPEQLIGKIIYVSDFFKERSVSDPGFFTLYQENNEFIGLGLSDTGAVTELACLDPGVSQLPPSMYDINSLPQIFSATGGTSNITGTYIFQKSDYQRFWNPQYFTAGLMESHVTDAVYSILPFVIRSATIEGTNLVITSEPFDSEIQMFPALTEQAILVFGDKSFAKKIPGGTLEYEYHTDVDPWMDETFTFGAPIEPAETYACSCPSYSKSILATPQATEDHEKRKVNRQRRYPLPTALGQERFAGAGAQSASGKIMSWENQADKLTVRMCKHKIAAMFEDNIKVIEPSQYPTVDAREKFQEKMEREFENYDRDFRLSFERSGISLTEIVFALSQGLNLSGTETAYVVLNSNE